MSIYMDNAYLTPLDSNVREVMLEVLSKDYREYQRQEIIEKSRKEIAEVINSEPEEVIFTSGQAESNALAIYGLAKANPEKKHIITSKIVHPSILSICYDLKKKGYTIEYLDITPDGVIDASTLERKIRKDTLVVSIMHANHELGTIQPIEAISAVCSRKDVYVHVDSTHTLKILPILVSEIPFTLVTASGHTIHGPKQSGFLYVRLGTRISPIIPGCGEEFRIRGGIQDISQIKGFSTAMKKNLDLKKLQEIGDFLEKEMKSIKDVSINGSDSERIPTILSVSIKGVSTKSLIPLLLQEGIYVSSYMPCSHPEIEESYVLENLQKSSDEVLRISISRFTTKEEILAFTQSIKKHINHLRGEGLLNGNGTSSTD